VAYISAIKRSEKQPQLHVDGGSTECCNVILLHITLLQLILINPFGSGTARSISFKYCKVAKSTPLSDDAVVMILLTVQLDAVTLEYCRLI
jgi:hypothetical protein